MLPFHPPDINYKYFVSKKQNKQTNKKQKEKEEMHPHTS